MRPKAKYQKNVPKIKVPVFSNLFSLLLLSLLLLLLLLLSLLLLLPLLLLLKSRSAVGLWDFKFH